MIKELCHKLKEKRATLGYSIEQTVEKTKLHPSVIRDIEACNLTNINSAYLKGFIKIYAAFLGVDLGQALGEIDSLAASTKKTKIIKRVTPNKSAINLERETFKISPEAKRKIVIVVVAIAVMWISLVVGGMILRGVSKAFRRGVRKTTSPVKDIPDSIPKKGELSVSLTVKKKCFLKVFVDRKLYFEGVLDKGARETWKGKKEIELKIKDGSAVHLEVNGKPIPLLTSLRKPIKSLKITASGISVDK